MSGTKRGVVLPCHNEARRLDVVEIARLRAAGLTVLVVDDGSSDDTARVARDAGCDVVVLAHNVGKGEAVRAGLQALINDNHDVVGYLDADFATPAEEYLRLEKTLIDDDSVAIVLGARVARLGAHIERRAHRHYLGRVFATGVSLALGQPIYDSQCGAKVLRATPTLAAALAEPFRSRWIFDVELLARLLDGGVAASALREVPLRRWRDVEGSHVSVTAMARAAADLAVFAASRRRA